MATFTLLHVASSASACVVLFICLLSTGTVLGETNSDPCGEYSDCIKQASVPTSRIIFTLFSLNFFRLAEEAFMLETCQAVQGLDRCATLLETCTEEGGAQARHFAHSDVTLAQWVCDNKEEFVTHSSCWDGLFLTEMSDCTGLIDFLAPVDCLTDKINALDQCSPQAREFFAALLTEAHAGY